MTEKPFAVKVDARDHTFVNLTFSTLAEARAAHDGAKAAGAWPFVECTEDEIPGHFIPSRYLLRDGHLTNGGNYTAVYETGGGDSLCMACADAEIAEGWRGESLAVWTVEETDRDEDTDIICKECGRVIYEGERED